MHTGRTLCQNWDFSLFLSLSLSLSLLYTASIHDALRKCIIFVWMGTSLPLCTTTTYNPYRENTLSVSIDASLSISIIQLLYSKHLGRAHSLSEWGPLSMYSPTYSLTTISALGQWATHPLTVSRYMSGSLSTHSLTPFSCGQTFGQALEWGSINLTMSGWVVKLTEVTPQWVWLEIGWVSEWVGGQWLTHERTQSQCMSV